MTVPPAIVVIADDLTGAADTGVQFRRFGMSARVLLGPAPPALRGATVYDTCTRSLPPDEAGQVVRAVGASARAAGHRLIYKKVDSTMRGNVGSELTALMAALGRPLAVLAPAFPANRRSTVGGVLLVDGVPVHQTAAASHPTHPMRFASIREALAAQAAASVELLPLDTVRRGPMSLAGRLSQLAECGGSTVAVVDAERDDDLEAIALAVATLGERCLPAGSAGLAAQLPPAWGLVGASVSRPDVASVRARVNAARVLFVCGSINPRTLEQIARLRIEPSSGLAEATARLRAGQPVVLSSATWVSELSADEVAAALGRQAAGVAAAVVPDALVLTGGDTARAVLIALGADGIDLERELLPGLPLGRLVGGRLAGTPLVTKAGGFGPPEALALVLQSFQEAPR